MKPEGTTESGKPGETLGRTKHLAIEVCQPAGERAYLSRLRCADGQAPRFERSGNVGPRHDIKPGTPDSVLLDQMDMHRPLPPGEVDYHVIDLYEVVCSDQTHEIYMDMYHCTGPQTKAPPAGFTMAQGAGI